MEGNIAFEILGTENVTTYDEKKSITKRYDYLRFNVDGYNYELECETECVDDCGHEDENIMCVNTIYSDNADIDGICSAFTLYCEQQGIDIKVCDFWLD